MAYDYNRLRDYIFGSLCSCYCTFFYNSRAFWMLFYNHFCLRSCNCYNYCNFPFKLLFSFMSYLSCNAWWSILLTLFFLLYSSSLYYNPLFLCDSSLTYFFSIISYYDLFLSKSSIVCRFSTWSLFFLLLRVVSSLW